MKKITVTLSRDTVGELVEGGALENAMQDLLSKIVNEEDGPSIESQVYLARHLVAFYDLQDQLINKVFYPAKEAVEVQPSGAGKGRPYSVRSQQHTKGEIMEKWTEVFAGIYHATCEVCFRSDNGWFFILNGLHSNGTRREKCHADIQRKERRQLKKEFA